MKIVLASGNRNKYMEMRDAFAPIGVELVFGGDFPTPLDVEETGDTYEENSALKARAWAVATGLPAIADDSGLEVTALDGAPGVRSARIVSGGDSARVDWLLKELSGSTDRSARFVCCITLAVHEPEPDTIACTRYCYGTIAREPRGSSGFGYDPVFVPDGYEKTFAELGEIVKKKISHRALAIKGIAEMLSSVVQYQTVRTMDNSPSGPQVGFVGKV